MAKKARIAVLGAGWWATEYHIPDLASREDVELTGVCRLGADELTMVKDRFGFDYASEDFREVLNNCEADGVVVASPHVAHFENASAALRRGAHVLVEKPMTTTADQARELTAIAAEAGRQIMIPHGFNFTHYMPAAADWIANGKIGDVRHVCCQMGSALLDLFGGEPMLETVDHTFRPPPSTWADPARAGGYGWGQLSHLLGALFRLVPSDPEQVFAMTNLSQTGVDYYDAATVRLANGTTCAISGAAGPPKHIGAHIDIRVYGTDGIIFLDIERERLELRRHDEQDEIFPFEPGEGVAAYSTSEPLNRFVDLCLGREIVNDGDGTVGRRSVEVLDAMYRSAASGVVERC
ncbi:MAG: Gfo/Idh/MocA family oxidoreductase [Pseudomonadota bacterium]